MIKCICDRCGHEVNAVVIPFTRKAIILEGVYRREYDLCKKCFYEAQMFLQGLPTEEAEQKGASDEQIK